MQSGVEAGCPPTRCRLQGVEGILDTAVHALVDNPDRTWVYADLAFFVKWWQELHPGGHPGVVE